MTFGSRSLGDRALQTSCTAPSSDHVAAIMGSRYCNHQRERGVSATAAEPPVRPLGLSGAAAHTLAFGGAALGLQASLTTLS